MNNERLGAILRGKFPNLSGTDGHWEAKHRISDAQEVRFFCMTCPPADRMRFAVPVVKIDGERATVRFLHKLLSANFHSALDARYAIDHGYIWSVFLHPLQDLTEEGAIDGIQQVLNLVVNFGTTFASTNMVFVGGHEFRRGDQPLVQTDQWREDKLKEQLENLQAENQSLKLLLKGNEHAGAGDTNAGEFPAVLKCPITHELMEDPVFAADGHTYERKAILEWFESHTTSPMTNERLLHLDLVPNYVVRAQVIDIKARQTAAETE